MGGSSSDQEQNISTVDESSNFTLADSDGSIVGGGDVNVQQTDFGAVQEAFGFGQDTANRAFDFGESNMRQATDSLDRTTGFAERALGGVLDFAGETMRSGQNMVGQSISASRSEGAQILEMGAESRQRMLLIGGGIAGTVALAYIIFRR